MKKVCLHDISNHTNVHQNRSINECSRMILTLKWSYMTLYDLKVILHFIKKLCLNNVDILEVLKRLGIKQKIYCIK